MDDVTAQAVKRWMRDLHTPWGPTMKKADVKIGHTYLAKVNGKIVKVTIMTTSSYGWDGRNLATGRIVRIKTAERLREDLTPDLGKPKMTPEERKAATITAIKSIVQEPMVAEALRDMAKDAHARSNE